MSLNSMSENYHERMNHVISNSWLSYGQTLNWYTHSHSTSTSTSHIASTSISSLHFFALHHIISRRIKIIINININIHSIAHHIALHYFMSCHVTITSYLHLITVYHSYVYDCIAHLCDCIG